MYANVEHLLEIAYELVRFFLFCILLYYGIKLYVWPFFYQQFQSLMDYYKTIEEKKFALDRTETMLHKKMEDQQSLINSLEHKVTMWHQGIVQEVDDTNQMLQNVHKKLIEKKKLQQKKFHKMRVQKEVFPDAIKHAHAHFQKEYAAEQGEGLLEILINKLDTKST